MQPLAGMRNATTSVTGAARMRPISLVDSESAAERIDQGFDPGGADPSEIGVLDD